ncbi:hypothetical protein N866_08485 [Actinotalea ferrariae CF5-4]|uniref:TrwC relaxase domain-containing protein n=1 Tax=Actinotalea ferrariae CF5-4 TaxID=948458 RepID=A0A021VMW7_9CELL|nr:relaxase domain-containing protein [Actinotalea ferrariae]EYR62448.1 hypothetical protein N866_08485 [Actinotalea ferrariae CF5-4]
MTQLITMHKLTAGDEYAYLTRHVASLGDATRRLHPDDVVSHRAITALFRDGRDPLTDDALGRGYSRSDDGRRRAVVGYDLTVTAPKSASVLWALGDDATRVMVHDAHRAALASSLQFFRQRVIGTCIGDARLPAGPGADVVPGSARVSSRDEPCRAGLPRGPRRATAGAARAVIPPGHPQPPWGRPAPQLSPYRLNSAPPPSLDGPDLSL